MTKDGGLLVAIARRAFLPAGEEPEEIGEAVEKTNDLGVGHFIRGPCEVDDAAFGTAAGDTGEVGVGAAHDTGLAGQRPAFELHGASGFECRHMPVQPFDFVGEDAV